jgi:Alanyl-tRNA synthetase
MVGDLHAHHAKVEKGELKVGDDVVMTIDPIRRAQLRPIIRRRICCTRRCAAISASM